MGKFIDFTGATFGRWTVVSRAGNRKCQTYWNCICSCGNSAEVYVGSLTRGKSISCGCFNKEGTINRCLSHGHANRDGSTRTYNCWRNMKARCSNPNNHKWAYYGGRGISYTKDWETFEGFLADMGECPSGNHSIDRIDNGGNYTKENCRWATPTQQSNNTRRTRLIEARGEIKTLSDWSKASGVNKSTISMRIDRSGWDAESAIFTPLKSR